MSRSLLGLATRTQRPNLHYSLTDPATGRTFNPPDDTGWRYGQERMKSLIDSGCILFPPKPDGALARRSSAPTFKPSSLHFQVLLMTYSQPMDRRDSRIIWRGCFRFSKPSALIERLVKQGCGDEGIVLDFFAEAHQLRKQ